MKRRCSLLLATISLGLGPLARAQQAAPASLPAPPSKQQVTTVKVKSYPLSPPTIAYLKVWDMCSREVMAKQFGPETASSCRQAADLANGFPPGQDFLGRHAVDDYAAIASMNIGDLNSALIYANRGVEATKVDPTDDPDNATAYGIRAKVEDASGNLAGAARDMAAAEVLQRKFVDLLVKYNPALAPRERAVLAGELQFHADILRKLGRDKDAQAKLDEAAKLQTAPPR